MSLRLSLRYACLTLALLAVEVVIALFVHDDFVRPYVGDTLAVMLLYCLVRTFFAFPVWVVLLSVLSFACALELAQALQLVSRLGLEHNTTMRVIIGTVFSWLDIAAYVAGVLLTWLVERTLAPQSNGRAT